MGGLHGDRDWDFTGPNLIVLKRDVADLHAINIDGQENKNLSYYSFC